MARIQVLWLPPERVGGVERTPYILVIDQVDDPDDVRSGLTDAVVESTGARAVLVFPTTVELVVPRIDDATGRVRPTAAGPVRHWGDGEGYLAGRSQK